MESIVTVYLWISPFSPFFIALLQRLSLIRDNKIDEGCRSSSKCRLGSIIEIVLGECAHKLQLKMCMSVNASRDDHLASAINDCCSSMTDRSRYICHFASLYQHITTLTVICIDNTTVLQEVGCEASLYGYQ